MPEILDKNPGAKLIIVGRGHMKKKLLKVARKMKIQNAIHIISSMSFEDLAQHFRSADLVIYPSYYEGQGLIPLEAMSSGTPVATVDQPPLTEMVDSSVGVLFKRGNSSDLADKVNEILADSTRRSSIVELGRERVLEKYTYEHNAKDYIEIYRSILPKD